MVSPGGMSLAEDIPSSYYHSDRMVAAVAVGMAPLCGSHGALVAAAWNPDWLRITGWDPSANPRLPI